MSAVGGIVSFTNKPIHEETLAVLYEGLADRGPDGGRVVRASSVGMIYRAFHTNHESRAEKQPMLLSDGRILAWDGRVDNRDELLKLLRDELRDDLTDVGIVMAAYNKWGIQFLQRIVADFALSLWDPLSRTLLLARDPLGTRLLYYHADRERIIWSSELEPLLNLGTIDLEIDDEYIAGYLTSRGEPWRTPYKNICAVPPAHIVRAREGRLHPQRFWGLDPEKEITYKTDTEYEDHFRSLFREAVRSRLRVEGTVWSDLSGGLDSSAIVCMADQVIRKQEAYATRLETVSAVFDQSASSDERRFISYVEQKRDQVGHHFRESDYPLLKPPTADEFKALPNLLESWAAYHKGVRRAMREQGVRVILCGIGGDELLTASPDPSPEVVDLLVQCKLIELHDRLQTWSLALGKPYLEVLVKHTLIPALPRRLQRLYKRRERAKPLALLQPRFIKRFNLQDRLLAPTDIFGFRRPSSRGQSIAFLSVMKVISSGCLHAWDTIEISYPFTHRPLVEFLQAIPSTQWIRPGETRSLMRRALRDYLPPEIAKRKGKGSPAEATLRAVAREWPRLRALLRDARVCARGYVDPTALKTLIDRPNPGCDPASLSVIRLSHLELWLRAFEGLSQTTKCAAAVRASSTIAGNRQ